MAHTTLTRDPAFTDYHAWNIEQEPAAWRLTCACGLDRTFSTKKIAMGALRIHMA